MGQIVLFFLDRLLSYFRFLRWLGFLDWCFRFFRFDVVCRFLICLNERLLDLAHIRPGHLCTSTDVWQRRSRHRARVCDTTRTLHSWRCWLTWRVHWTHVEILVARGHDNAVRGADGLLHEVWIWIMVCLLMALNFQGLPVFVVCYFALVFVKIIEDLLVGDLSGHELAHIL